MQFGASKPQICLCRRVPSNVSLTEKKYLVSVLLSLDRSLFCDGEGWLSSIVIHLLSTTVLEHFWSLEHVFHIFLQ